MGGFLDVDWLICSFFTFPELGSVSWLKKVRKIELWNDGENKKTL